MPQPTRTLRLAGLIAAAAAALGLAACSDPLFRRQISAGAGGTVRAADGAVTVTIPAGALSQDADVVVTELASPPGAGADQIAAGKAWRISLVPAGVTLSKPMTVAVQASEAPVHPQIGELATLSGSTWTRLPASFVRAPSTVLGLSTSPNATYRAVFRTLQRVDPASDSARRGFEVFMYETFGNEAFFTGLGLAALLNTVKPVDAVALGVQVDLAKVPAAIRDAMLDDSPAGLATKDAALADPATTIALVKAGAVVGVVDRSAPTDTTLTKVGVTCALCHQLVTPTTFTLTAGQAALPIGPLAVDGRPNVAMDAGKILSFTAGAGDLAPTLAGWGPARFDVRNPTTVNGALDDESDNPTVTPPIWNFKDLEAAGYPFGWDGLFAGTDALASQAEAVYHLVMGGAGAFAQPGGAIAPALRITPPERVLGRLQGAASPSPVITAGALRDLQDWMRSVTSPAPGAFDAAKAEQGWRTFHTRGCAGCHSTPELSGDRDAIIHVERATGDLAGGLHVPALRGRAAAGAPYLHDGRAASLAEAVADMATLSQPALTAEEQAAVVEYLKSL